MVSLTNMLKKQKLSMSFLLIIMLFLFFGIFTIKGLFTLGNLTKMIYEHPLVVSNASLDAVFNITKIHRNMKDIVLANSPDEIEVATKDIAESQKKVYQQLDVIRKDILGEEGQALEKQTRKLFENWQPLREEVVLLINSGNKQDAVQITKTRGADKVAELELRMLELSSYARRKAAGFLEYAEATQTSLEKSVVMLTLIGIFLSLIIAFIATYRVIKTEKALLDKNDKLKKAIDEIKVLRGIIPICSHCKQIRDDEGMWKRMEEYIHTHSEARFSHGICPDCMRKHYPEESASIDSDEKHGKKPNNSME
ncbi:MAG: MCP four helix bundle domain-containing protein [Candidatus Theseobacter exili]|nr:MCP four helix bundle domain-containing protein [Candidatus Theseobacter exili]